MACSDNSTVNLSIQEIAAIKQLQNNMNVIIKPVDEDGAVVVTNRELGI